MQNFERVRKAIMGSGIPGDDKMALNDVFAEIPDEHLADVAALLEKDAGWVEKLNENRKKKKEALATGNQALWNEIMAEEKGYLETLPYDLD